ncbi:MAG: hypothetical protein AVDCRST_MAG10-3369 [uncultured Acidimicrobiales bacterium]|uniref:Uncharacterized protein n=1 Tax=uncultured Acidimicrobiales bacterium TaxID=310071 RepID=A0A6J4JA30_9ACTN|nr:MAG: hypothetical protein AVDCRST_MAG10-3369 [uncultured Acidimicrobiales bacterium]
MIAATEWGWNAWAWLVIPLAIYGLTSLTLFALGSTDETNPLKFFFGQIGDSLQRFTGYPGWSMAGVLSGLIMLLVVVIGFYWDVAWHIDNGRDDELFTPSHVMILVGLGGLIYAAGIAVLFASLEKANTALKFGFLHVPWSAVLLTALGIGGVVAFPLDAMWHDAYGVDVTLWSPPHIQLVISGSLGTIALWLMLAEARPWAEPTLLGRFINVLTAGTVLVGMSTLQGEFDYGVPQFQVLYLPVLIMIAAGFTLLAVRRALGPWGAVKVVGIYLVLRAFLAFSIGGVLNHTVPHFPLYLGSALVVEAAFAWLGTRRPLRLALVTGALVGTVGLITELGWVTLWGFSTSARLPAALALKIAILGPIAAIAAALVGTAFGGAVAKARERIPAAALAAAGVAIVGTLAFPLPRDVGPVTATVRLVQIGSMADVDVTLDPPDAARTATAFAVSAWQGGSETVQADLKQVAMGRYVASRPVPVTGSWKTMVSLQRGDEVMAVPVYLPADPEIGAPEVPAVPERTERFVRNTTILLREVKEGPAGAAVAAYSGLAVVAAVYIGLIALTARRVPPFSAPPDPPDRLSSPPAWAAPAPA